MRTLFTSALSCGASLVLVGAVCTGTAHAAVTGDSTTWEGQFDGSQLPDAEGWTANGPVDSFTSVVGDGTILMNNLTANQSDAYGWYTRGDETFDLTSGASLEARVKLNSDSSDLFGQWLALEGTNNQVEIRFLPGQVQLDLSNSFAFTGYAVDTTAWHTYRVAAKTGTGNVHFYIDGTEVPLAPNTLAGTGTYGHGPLFFGDPSGSAGVASDLSYDYIRWTNQGAFAPVSVPEPASAAVIAVGLGAFMTMRRRRRVV